MADSRVAVVGIGLVVPGATDPAGFWRLRLDGAEPFVPPPADRWDPGPFAVGDTDAEDKTYQSKAGFVTDFPGEGEATTGWLRHSLADALRGVRRRDGDRFGLTLGYTPDFNQHLEEAGVALSARERCRRLGIPTDRIDERYRDVIERPTRFLPHHVGRAVAELLPPGTPVRMVDAACASSLFAIDVGMRALRSGDLDIAVCGGASALTPRTSVLFAKLGGLSRDGAVKAFDHDADGTLFADGAAVVVLKTVERARADGDRIMAVLSGMGCSSDGKGTAIHAPNPTGQALAIRRAHGTTGELGQVDWIAAHATGTPTGDHVEYTALGEEYRDAAEPIRVTSNKSLIGHTGWAAGAASLIEVVLALRHELMPPQLRFTRPPAEFDASALTVPTAAAPWPSGPRPRTAAVSGFGFGGVNAHLLVSEDHPEARVDPLGGHAVEPVAVVGWSARFPGLSTTAEVVDWLTGGDTAPLRSFDDDPISVPFDRIRLPPPTQRTIDRCQLMLTECAHGLRDQLAGIWDDSVDRTGVLLGHMGPTGAAMRYADRCHVHAIGALLRTGGASDELVDRYIADVRGAVPPSNPNSFAGMMPNVVPARVCNHFGLRGPSLTVDAGRASTLAALEIAVDHLRSGDLDVTLVAGANGNTLPGYTALLGDGEPAEGAVMFALATERFAMATGLPILALIAETEQTPAPILPVTDAAYLGAAAAVSLLRVLTGPSGRSLRMTSTDDPRGLTVLVGGR